MSVIGRLDDQVEAVLINPLKRRERANDYEEEPDAPPLPPAASHEERDTESSLPETRATEATLPVWLL